MPTEHGTSIQEPLGGDAALEASPWRYMSPLLQFRDKQLEAQFRRQRAEAWARFDALLSLVNGTLAIAMAIKLQNQLSPVRDPHDPAKDYLDMVFEVGQRLLPVLMYALAGERMYCMVRTPLHIGTRLARLVRWVSSLVLQGPKALDTNGLCVTLRAEAFGLAVSSNFTTPLFSNMLIVHHVPVQLATLLASSYVLVRPGGICDGLGAGSNLQPGGACSRLQHFMDGFCTMGHYVASSSLCPLTPPLLSRPDDPCRTFMLSWNLLSSVSVTLLIYYVELRQRIDLLRSSRRVQPPPCRAHLLLPQLASWQSLLVVWLVLVVFEVLVQATNGLSRRRDYLGSLS